jgi:hypothetical protein
MSLGPFADCGDRFVTVALGDAFARAAFGASFPLHLSPQRRGVGGAGQLAQDLRVVEAFAWGLEGEWLQPPGVEVRAVAVVDLEEELVAAIRANITPSL